MSTNSLIVLGLAAVNIGTFVAGFVALVGAVAFVLGAVLAARRASRKEARP